MVERHRGAELEHAILEAAWLELEERGYAGLTMEAVAERSGTSRTVLARRWDGKAALHAIMNFAPPPLALRKAWVDTIFPAARASVLGDGPGARGGYIAAAGILRSSFALAPL